MSVPCCCCVIIRFVYDIEVLYFVTDEGACHFMYPSYLFSSVGSLETGLGLRL